MAQGDHSAAGDSQLWRSAGLWTDGNSCQGEGQPDRMIRMQRTKGTMFSKCANPDCGVPFDYREGISFDFTSRTYLRPRRRTLTLSSTFGCAETAPENTCSNM